MFLGNFCSSKHCSKQAWQNSSYFITFTLHNNVYPQHGGGNTEALTSLSRSPYLCNIHTTVWVYNIIFVYYPNVTIAVANPSVVCRRPSVCNVRATYSARWNFPQCFYPILYHRHPVTSAQHFAEIVPGEPEPFSRGRVKRNGVTKCSDVGHVEGYISEKVQDTASGTINDW